MDMNAHDVEREKVEARGLEAAARAAPAQAWLLGISILATILAGAWLHLTFGKYYALGWLVFICVCLIVRYNTHENAREREHNARMIRDAVHDSTQAQATAIAGLISATQGQNTQAMIDMIRTQHNANVRVQSGYALEEKRGEVNRQTVDHRNKAGNAWWDDDDDENTIHVIS